MDQNRRKFLKLVLFGGGSLIAGRVLGPFLSAFGEDQKESQTSSFKIVEDEKILTIFDNSGVEVLQIDKSGSEA